MTVAKIERASQRANAVKPRGKEHQSLRSLSQMFRTRNLWIVGLSRSHGQRLSCYVRHSLQGGQDGSFSEPSTPRPCSDIHPGALRQA